MTTRRTPDAELGQIESTTPAGSSRYCLTSPATWAPSPVPDGEDENGRTEVTTQAGADGAAGGALPGPMSFDVNNSPCPD